MILFTPYLYMAISMSDIKEKLIGNKPLAAHEMSLDDRYQNPWVNQIFKDNILLSLAYMGGKVKKGDAIDWQKVESPNHYEFTLDPNQVFAFHDEVLDGYKDQVTQTTKSHFSLDEGFKSDGYLPGDGVCHLASLINWTAQDANLDVNAPTSHSFAKVPDIPDKYSVSIYNQPNSVNISANQNLYIRNNRPDPVKFVIDYKDNTVSIVISNISTI